MKSYDLIVIGSGGGSKIARPAAQLGFKAAIIEDWKWGGTCLNRGCIPSKMLIHPANVMMGAKHGKRIGLDLKGKADFTGIVKRITKEITTDSNSVPGYWDKIKNLDYYHGKARFVSNKVIEVNGKKFTAKKIFITSGARPFVPPIPGLKGTPFWTSTDALKNQKLPKKLIVIGGGYIAAELGHAYSALGSDVHWLIRGKCLLDREDAEIKEVFSKQFRKEHNVHVDTNTEMIAYKNGKFTLSLDTKGRKHTLSGDALLIATGVIPNSDRLGLEKTTVKTNKRGWIQTNLYAETSAKGVYAMGDVTGRYLFRHAVNWEGEFLLDSLYKKKKRMRMNYPPMPHAVFSNPEIGAVGKTEDELKEKKIPYVKAIHEYKSSAQGMARRPEVGMVKLLFHKKTRKLIGAHIVGEEASIMIHQLIYAMTFQATVDDLYKMIYIHPALPEIVRNAVRKALEQFNSHL